MAAKLPSLNVLSGPLSGRKFVIEDAVDNILIGSDSSCGFVLDTPGVSPIHARLWVDLNGATVYDTNSPAGVYVNDDRVVKEAPVRNGDILWLGPPGEEGSVLIQCILPIPGAVAPVAAPAPPVEDAPADTGATMAFGVPAFMPDESEFAPSAGGQGDTGEPAHEMIELEPTVSYPDTDATMLLDGSEGLEMIHEPAPVPPPAPAPAPAAAPAVEAPIEEFGGFPDFDVEPTVGLPPPLPRSEPVTAAPRAPAQAEFEDELEPTMVDVPAPPVVVPPAAAAAPMPPPVPDHDLEEDDAATVMYRPAAAPVMAPPVAPPPPAPPAPTPPAAASPAPPAAPAPAVARPPKVAAPTPRVAAAAPSARPPAEARPPRATPGAPAAPAAARPPAPAPRARAERAAPADVPAPVRRGGGGSGKAPLIAGGVVAVAVLAFAAFWFMRPKAVPVAEATPIPAPPVTQAAPPVALDPPVTQAAAPPDTLPPPPVAAATPIPVASSAVRSPVPSPRVAAATPAVPPGQRPGATLPGQRPPVAATAPPAGPSAAQQAAAAVTNLMTQARTATDAKNYDAAVTLYDEVLKLDPQNGPASAGRTAALAARTASRRTFVSSRTVVQTEQKAKGPTGFDTSDVSVKSLDFTGRIEFAMNPPTVKPGEPYRLQIAVVNEGKKAIKISGMTFTVTVNGQKTGNPIAPKVKEVGPTQRVVLEELPGVFPEGTTTWMAEVLVTANKGDSLKNQITWK